MVVCPSCGTENPEIARFCMACATALGAPTPTREARKVVTVVFADVTGSTGLGEHLDPESLRAILGRWFEAMRDVLERHGGTVEKFIGDAVVAVFGVPVLHEDDALRAVRAAFDMKAALETLNRALEGERGLTIQMRVGINTGQVVVGDARAGGSRATGDAVNVAARLQTAAEPDEILVGESTWRLVRDAASAGEPREVRVKGRDGPVLVRRLVGVDQSAEAIHRRVGGPMVGRDRDLGVLRAAHERSVLEERCVLVTVLGAAGVGKSRLVQEFVDGVPPGSVVLRGRCLPYGQAITWYPVAELLRGSVGLGEEAEPRAVLDALAERLAGSPDTELILRGLAVPLGIADDPPPIEELLWAVRRFLERLAADGPVIVILDDLQWAEQVVLDLVEHLAEWVRGVPLFILAMARPELLDSRRGWGGGKPDATTFLLEPLGSADTEHLVQALLDGGTIEPDVRARIAAAADGNPLYVEQVIEMLLDDDVVRRLPNGALTIGALDSISVPPTIQALLAARLDRLSEPERRTIERAAVVGKEFAQREVSELTPVDGRNGVSGNLLGLVRKELIRPERRRDDGAETYRFRHLLIRDAAYDSLPKVERAELHERFADWLERTAGDRLAELDEVVGYHLEQARGYRLDLGPADERSRSLGLRAGRRLADAGVRAADRDEFSSAKGLLTRALELLVDDPMVRFDAVMRLLPIMFEDDYAETLRVARLAESIAAGLGALPVLRARLWIANARALMEPGFLISTMRAETEVALTTFEAAGDLEGTLDSCRMLLFIDLQVAHWAGAAKWSRRGFDLATQAGRARERAEFARWLGNAMIWGLTPVPEALATIAALPWSAVSRRERSDLLSGVAVIKAFGGDRAGFDDAIAESMAIRSDLGLWVPTFRAAYGEFGLGDLEAALRLSRQSAAELERRNDTGARSTMVGLAAWILALQGDDHAATAEAEAARELSADDDAVSQILWRVAASVSKARQGAAAEADRLSLEALEVAAATDSLDTISAWQARAMTLQVLGRPADATEAARRARDLAAQKGAVNLMRRAEALLL